MFAVLTVCFPSVFKNDIPNADVTLDLYCVIVSVFVISTFGSTYSIFSTLPGGV